ncbi:MAG TPA: maleylpyruvate isomerase family mycothiol-dependent enzyme [Acidimicrobiales bacterium]|nr:maleylpyruvate isomerase family mycothiol-dependent enzyme [Acidimicrobiales bacterium]
MNDERPETDDRELDRELEGLDPYELLDIEASRLDDYFSGLNSGDWGRQSRCVGWTTRDMLGHLTAGEDYHRACLDGKVKELFAGFAERGATDLDSANALGVAEYSSMSTEDLHARWRETDSENRRSFRERGSGAMDTSVGDYPSRLQAFHVASELATHADDIGVPVTDEERARRRAWRARFSRFALAETKPGL